MNHNIDFFRDEIRNGFYIPTAIKQSWAAELDVLAEIDRICKKYGITYFADWGTFLGAVRHGGFVPWDDDLDICMLRDDYEKFRQVADQELPQEYCIHDYERHEDHWLFLSRVVSSSRINFDEHYLNSHYNYPWLTGIDIFVKDYLYKNPEDEKRRCDEILYILAVAESIINGSAIPSSLYANLDDLEQKYSWKFETRQIGRDLAVSLYKLAEKQMSRVPKTDSDRVGQIFPWGLKGMPGEPIEYYENSLLIPFEDTFIPVPSFINKSLGSHYGDYNVVKKGLAAHGYPAFEGQRVNFETAANIKLPKFSFEPAFLNIDRGPKHSHESRRVLFLPIGPGEWEGFESTYNKEVSAKDTEIVVVPLPLMPKNCLGQITLTDEEINDAVHLEDYPENLPIVSWAEYDLEQHQPDVIYIQSPYDAENPYLTLPPYYYAENLIFYTKELVYIPIGPVADFTKEDIPDQKVMDFYVTMPGVILADRILLHSENLKAHYVDKLTAFTGTDDTRNIWENRITVIPNLYTQLSAPANTTLKNELPIPVETSTPSSYDSRKKFLYCISSYEVFEHADNFETAIKNRIDLLKDNSEKLDVSVCTYPPGDVPKIVSSSGFPVVSFDLKNIEEFVSGFDAYYGSSTPLVPIFAAQKKPVMISNYELDL
ncbi:MAG: LicD family protein [Butyrivibrio sp.]|nr:LicD family protein [Butyrivibrio sp.]